MLVNPANERGKRAEREAAKLLHDALGYDVKRTKAGQFVDIGDLSGIPDTVVQVKDWSEVLRAIHAARDDADEQARAAMVPFRFGMVRSRGGVWTCVQSVDALTTMLREALA